MAQVAAFADHHILVSKTADSDNPRSDHGYLQGDQRNEQLARMLSDKISASSLQHAQKILHVAALGHGL